MYLITALVFLVVLAFYRIKSFMKTTEFLRPDKKVVLLTGCDSGIGLGTAKHFHQLGFHVFAGLCQIGSEGSLKIQELKSDRLVPIQLDVTKQSEIDAAVETIKVYCEKNSCHFWSLVNNAGVCVLGKVEWQTWEQIERQVNVNVFGTLRMIRAFIPMLKQTRGRIVNVTSISTRWPLPNFAPYAGTKSALEGFSRVLRLDLAPSGIKVIVVSPGNHCRITKLFDNQMEYAKQQWDSFTPELRKDLDRKFWNLQTNVLDFSRFQSPKHFENSAIERHMQSAVMAVEPKPYYLSSTLIFQMLVHVFEWLPAPLQTSAMLQVAADSLLDSKDVPFYYKI